MLPFTINCRRAPGRPKGPDRWYRTSPNILDPTVEFLRRQLQRVEIWIAHETDPRPRQPHCVFSSVIGNCGIDGARRLHLASIGPPWKGGDPILRRERTLVRTRRKPAGFNLFVKERKCRGRPSIWQPIVPSAMGMRTSCVFLYAAHPDRATGWSMSNKVSTSEQHGTEANHDDTRRY